MALCDRRRGPLPDASGAVPPLTPDRVPESPLAVPVPVPVLVAALEVPKGTSGVCPPYWPRVHFSMGLTCAGGPAVPRVGYWRPGSPAPSIPGNAAWDSMGRVCGDSMGMLPPTPTPPMPSPMATVTGTADTP